MNKKRVVACIPARGNSKRIPQKNIVPFLDKPLIAHAITAAKECRVIDSVWVSTNDKQIMDVARHYGAEIVRRPDTLCGDTQSSEDALIHFAHEVAFEVLVFIQATSPLTTSEELAKGIDLVLSGHADSCLAVCEDKRFYWNAKREPVNYDLMSRPRSQDKEPWYKETGAFYITTRRALLDSKCRISGKIEYVVVPESRSFEIDTLSDLELLKTIAKHLP